MAKDPFDEGRHACLIEALCRSDRRTDALRACRDLHATLVDELGVGPSPRLLQLRSSILADEPGTPDRWLGAVP
ncbi:BTAD domain-containing putative transcriptional regulator [Amycolatopsis sp. NPDC023774]|uniref:AfsR/SARP family transcriptional regulator n=1 Tax=Amycolatopsis sp. NPDC023774 TaxID=3155015 RepID=UPI003403F1A0